MTREQYEMIRSGRGHNLNTTCDGDNGYGPCGQWSGYYYDADGETIRCAEGHVIVLDENKSV